MAPDTPPFQVLIPAHRPSYHWFYRCTSRARLLEIPFCPTKYPRVPRRSATAWALCGVLIFDCQGDARGIPNQLLVAIAVLRSRRCRGRQEEGSSALLNRPPRGHLTRHRLSSSVHYLYNIFVCACGEIGRRLERSDPAAARPRPFPSLRTRKTHRTDCV